MPTWEVGEDEPDERPYAACQFCLADLPNGEKHNTWCPVKGDT